MSIIFNAIKTNSLNTNCIVAVGENRQGEWDSDQKKNSGFGKIVGCNGVIIKYSKIMDNDIIDIPIYSPSIVKQEHNKKLDSEEQESK